MQYLSYSGVYYGHVEETNEEARSELPRSLARLYYDLTLLRARRLTQMYIYTMLISSLCAPLFKVQTNCI